MVQPADAADRLRRPLIGQGVSSAVRQHDGEKQLTSGTATSNHMHQVVQDQGREALTDSMRLVAGRTAQAFDGRKARGGAF